MLVLLAPRNPKRRLDKHEEKDQRIEPFHPYRLPLLLQRARAGALAVERTEIELLGM